MAKKSTKEVFRVLTKKRGHVRVYTKKRKLPKWPTICQINKFNYIVQRNKELAILNSEHSATIRFLEAANIDLEEKLLFNHNKAVSKRFDESLKAAIKFKECTEVMTQCLAQIHCGFDEEFSPELLEMTPSSIASTQDSGGNRYHISDEDKENFRKDGFEKNRMKLKTHLESRQENEYSPLSTLNEMSSRAEGSTLKGLPANRTSLFADGNTSSSSPDGSTAKKLPQRRTYTRTPKSRDANTTFNHSLSICNFEPVTPQCCSSSEEDDEEEQIFSPPSFLNRSSYWEGIENQEGMKKSSRLYPQSSPAESMCQLRDSEGAHDLSSYQPSFMDRSSFMDNLGETEKVQHIPRPKRYNRSELASITSTTYLRPSANGRELDASMYLPRLKSQEWSSIGETPAANQALPRLTNELSFNPTSRSTDAPFSDSYATINSSTGEAEFDGDTSKRPSRRARKAISYKEESLGTKLRNEAATKLVKNSRKKKK